MRFDFWNNPLVVSAYRVKYRAVGPSAITAFYLLILIAGAVVLYRYSEGWPVHWTRVYFVALLGLQSVLSGLLALGTTWSSMNSEVVNRTLDFQRIAALSPRAILVGKLLGEPAIAYHLATATIPLGVFCWLLGGVSPAELVLGYVTLATTIVFCGTLGLQHRLELPTGRAGGGGSVPGWGILFLLFSSQLGTAAAAGVSQGWLKLLSLITPIGTIVNIGRGDLWFSPLIFFGREVPAPVVTLVLQVSLAAMLFGMMCRRLQHPGLPPLSKGGAYVALAVIDVVAAGVAFDPPPMGDPAEAVVTFLVLHSLASLWLMTLATPKREAMVSWIWRNHGRPATWRERFVGPRTAAVAANGVFLLIGGLAFWFAVCGPILRRLPEAEQGAFGGLALVAWGTMALVVFAVSTLYQWFVLAADRHGGLMCIILTLTLWLTPLIAGEILNRDWVRSLSPICHFVRWLQPDQPPLMPWLLVLAYGFMLVYSGAVLGRRVSLHVRAVDGKLASMGVVTSDLAS